MPRAARRCSACLRTVLFAPEDLALVKGDPAERRRFLDDLLVARAHPGCAGVRADYDRVLKQRNALLKSARARDQARARATSRTLDVWDSHLAAAGAEPLAARLGAGRRSRRRVAAAHTRSATTRGASAAISRLGAASAEREPDAAPVIADRGAAGRRGCWPRWRGLRKAELERGISLVGPHRERPGAGAGADARPGRTRSHGESGRSALALRLASYELLRSEPGA